MPLRKNASSVSSAMLLATTVAVIVALAALLATIGSDAKWLAALGDTILQRHSVPDGVPFAAAPTGHWPNVIVLAELTFSGLEQILGDRGLVLAQLVAVGTGMTLLARGALAQGAGAAGVSVALLLAGLGSLPSLVIVRVQLFSVILFPLLLVLLRSEARRPSRRIWLAVPLLALWSNLHGAVLVGLMVLIAYLALSRSRRQPLLAAGVALASLVALCLTPALAGTVSYYQGVLSNVAAQRGQGLWGPLSLSAPLDLVLIVAAVGLCVKLRRGALALWEVVVIAGLAALTIHASRSGVWLLFFLVAPAAGTMKPARTWARVLPYAAAASVAAVALALVRGPVSQDATSGQLTRVIKLAHGTPVLASDGVAEQLALAGGRVWVADPIDAFAARDQGAYLDWIQGTQAGRRALNAQVQVVVVTRRSPAQKLMDRTPGFVAVTRDVTTKVYERLR